MRNHDGCHLDAFAVAIVSLACIRAQLGQREAYRARHSVGCVKTAANAR
jgi:hypothetical protein